jgi:TusE/DsrC/DsvC family sulfur relay protein
MDKQVSGVVISVNEEGYMTDLGQWTKDVALELAKEEGIELTDKHWQVLEFLQQSYRNSVPLSIRSMGKHGPVTIKELYELFPGGPLKKSSRIAGIPKPASCV